MPFEGYTPAEIIGLAIALVAGITFHEFSHAATADALGDHRPRALGRVSLNPARHIDPVGAIVFVVARFGWGKPVPVNPAALRPGRIGMAYVAAAGPIANLVLALVVAVAFRVAGLAGVLDLGDGLLQTVLFWTVFYNVALALFNLLPIPPLDGYNLVLPFLPPHLAFRVQRYAPYGVLVLLGLVFLSYSGAFSPLGWLFSAASRITGVLLGA